jgi:hypothetical protein
MSFGYDIAFFWAKEKSDHWVVFKGYYLLPRQYLLIISDMSKKEKFLHFSF